MHARIGDIDDPRNSAYNLDKYQGTSMSGPQVAGVLAILAESWPNMTQAEAQSWLINNANKYGFYQVYTDKINGRTGYNLERWHWSYLPLASKYLEYYNKNITYSEINGFNGFEHAKTSNIISDYVNGISDEALNYKSKN